MFQIWFTDPINHHMMNIRDCIGRQIEKINGKHYYEHTFERQNNKRRHLYEQKHERETLQQRQAKILQVS